MHTLYLHSNMELLLQCYDCIGKCTENNLHSNMELLLPPSGLKHKVLRYEFTFQYGATSTEKLEEIERALLKFTFQYGATSTILPSLLNAGVQNLHSNMELLLQSCNLEIKEG